MNHTDTHQNRYYQVSASKVLCPAVLLVSLNWARDKDPRLPLGHACLLASLKSAGRQASDLVIAVNKRLDVDQLARVIVNQAQEISPKPLDLCIGAYVWGEPTIQKLLPKLRKAGFNGRIILGGPQITFMEAGYEDAYPEADVFIRGQAEQALVEVTASLDPIQFPGVHYAGRMTQPAIAQANLDDLPSPWEKHNWDLDPAKFVRMETMRGCPYSCSFCQHRAPKRGKRLHYHQELRILREIDLFCTQGVKSIAILDPIFNISPKATDVLMRFVENGYTGRISVQCRAELIKDEFLQAAKDLNITLEFGLQTIHTKESVAINRRNHIEKVDAALKKVRNLNINHEVSLIFGLPGQTLESFKQSVDWCLNHRIPVIKAFPLMLLRGTELEVSADRWGLRQSSSTIPTVIESDTFTESDWQQMNYISEKLKETENHHPESLEALNAPSLISESTDRWTP